MKNRNQGWVPMKRLLSKAEQEKFAWDWMEDPHLALIYKTFQNYVESRVGPYIIDPNAAD